MGFVLDASIALSWCFTDEASAHTWNLLERLEEETAFVPSLWPLEVGNILILAERRKRISYAHVILSLELMGRLPIQVDEETAYRAFHETSQLAHREALTSYDASYLELALRLGVPLATKDKALAKVAKKLGVSLI
ncbi:MAG: PIN domain-containing protein [Candidatus Aquirickettsiella gammari]|jgi:predicted nucleic acid-binding protein|uniref:PIN domain-containing protein n=1 Tax=Candidatus Aquirickettsiella gammari TaxID=2016198 RepID=A0A370CHC5_9COXI|nr:MAG: PIN domain-containing protein [Candidatus Aquirickettsiella gammari]